MTRMQVRRNTDFTGWPSTEGQTGSQYALEGKTMNANQQIEAFFLARKAEGRGNSSALDATVEHFAQYNPMYVRTHIRHCALWGA
ncbi:hypothetical protein HKW72_01135 [Pseudomonas aeruginosa]|nr:hypothetical protein [Pseudomonas aeruginosa]